MYHIAAIALPIAFEKHHECHCIGFAMSMADTYTTPKFIQHRGCCKSADSKANICRNIDHAKQRKYHRTECCYDYGNAQITPQSSRRSSSPGQQWANSHCQYENDYSGS